MEEVNGTGSGWQTRPSAATSTLRILQHSLLPEEVIVAYFTTDDEIVVWLIKANKLLLRVVTKDSFEFDTNHVTGEISNLTSNICVCVPVRTVISPAGCAYSGGA